MDSFERFNIYSQIHKALRACMADVLLTVDRLDPNDTSDVDSAAEAVRALIGFAREHLQHEEEWIHPALEARRVGASTESHGDHAQHLESFVQLESSVRAMERSQGPQRARAAQRLYRQLALFVAENFEHMHIEETENHAVLVACYSEQEIFELHDRLVAAVKPATMAVAMRWMIPASSAPERAAVLAGIKRGAPAAAFAAVLDLVRPHHAARDWIKLGTAIGPLPAGDESSGAATTPGAAVAA